MAWIQPIIGRGPSSPEILLKAEEACELTVRAIEKEIQGKEYLVGDTLTLADLFVVSGLARGYQYVRFCRFLLGSARLPEDRSGILTLYRSSQSLGLRSIQLCTAISCAFVTTRMAFLIAYLGRWLCVTSQGGLIQTTMVFKCTDKYSVPILIHKASLVSLSIHVVSMSISNLREDGPLFSTARGFSISKFGTNMGFMSISYVATDSEVVTKHAGWGVKAEVILDLGQNKSIVSQCHHVLESLSHSFVPQAGSGTADVHH